MCNDTGQMKNHSSNSSIQHMDMDCGEKVLWCLVLLALFTGVERVDGWTNVTGQWLNNQCNKFDKYRCGDVCQDRTSVLLIMRPCECGGEKYDRFGNVIGLEMQ